MASAGNMADAFGWSTPCSAGRSQRANTWRKKVSGFCPTEWGLPTFV